MEPASLSIIFSFIRAAKPEKPYEFSFEPQAYTRLDGDNALASPNFPWSSDLLGLIESLREPSPPLGTIKAIGDVLERFLDGAKWTADVAKLHNALGRQRVQITIRSKAAELYSVPWELVTVPRTDQRLGAVPNVLLRYEWTGTNTTPTRIRVPKRPRVLVAWAGDVPHQEHVSAIEDAARKGDRSLEIVQLANASYAKLKRELAESPVHALHILCHGARRGLYLAQDKAPEKTELVDSSAIARLLAEHASEVRLVVLAACDGGNAGIPGARLGSVAQGIHRVGIQCVIASRYPLSVHGSSIMASALYRRLFVDGATIEDAFLSTRSAVQDPKSFDWASLQLYARAGDGDQTRLFQALRREYEDLRQSVCEVLEASPKLLQAFGDLLKRPRFKRAMLPEIVRGTGLTRGELRQRVGDPSELADSLLKLPASTLLHWLRWLLLTADTPKKDELEELVGELLPYCYRWDLAETTRTRVKAGQIVEVPVATETVAEIVLARADERPATFVISRNDLLPMGHGAVVLPVEPDTDEDGCFLDTVHHLAEKFMLPANPQVPGGLDRLRARLHDLADPKTPEHQPTYLILNPYVPGRGGMDVEFLRAGRLLTELPELRCIRLTRKDAFRSELQDVVESLTKLLATTDDS